MATHNHYIDDQWMPGGGTEFTSTDPASGETIWTGRSATPAEVDDAVTAARRAFEPWADRPLSERIHCLERFASKLVSNRDELARVVSLETGKPRWESVEEVTSMIGKVALSVQAYNERRNEAIGELGGAVAATRYRPIGV